MSEDAVALVVEAAVEAVEAVVCAEEDPSRIDWNSAAKALFAGAVPWAGSVAWASRDKSNY
jgi:hypothetical protein